MRRYTLPAVGMLGIAALALTGCQTTDQDAASAAEAPITIATLPMSDDPTQVNPIEALVELLEAETGREVEVTDVPDYLSVVEAIRSDHVDIGIMSGFPSALAVNTGEVDALLAWKGSDAPVSTCVVLDDSPIQTVEDFEGKTVAFADQASSSGYFMPVYMLHEAGLEQGTDYKAIFAGGHEGSFAALQQGQVDGACTAFVLTQMGAPMFPFAEGEWRAVGERWFVRDIPAHRAEKAYRCPDCGSDIPPGQAHFVAWSAEHLFGDDAAVQDRRHYHAHCWRLG